MERQAADEQAARGAMGGILSDNELAATFQIGSKQLSQLGIPRCEQGYRVDRVVEWLAAERERQRIRDEALLAIAVVSASQAADLLAISQTSTIALDQAPDIDVVGLILPPRQGAHVLRRRGEKPEGPHRKRFRYRSLQRLAGEKPSAIQDVMVREGEVAFAFGITPDVLRRMWPTKKEDFLACGREQPFLASPGDPVYSVNFMNRKGRIVVEPAAIGAGTSRTMRRRRQEEEWAALKAKPNLFPRPVEKDGVRWYRLPEIAAWLDALEDEIKQARTISRPLERPVQSTAQREASEDTDPMEMLTPRQYFMRYGKEVKYKNLRSDWQLEWIDHAGCKRSATLETVNKNRAVYSLAGKEASRPGGGKPSQFYRKDLDAVFHPQASP